MKSTFDDAMLSASFGRVQGQASDLRNSVRGLGQSSAAGLTQEQKNRRLRDACEGFESIFIQKMWQQMRATLPKEGLLKGRDEAYWQDMYDQELAKSMTSAGGIGLADMMFEQLSRNLVSASRTTATAMAPRKTAFAADAAPLLPPSQETADAGGKGAAVAPGKAMNASIYEGVAPQEGLVPQAAQDAQQAQATAQATPAAATPAAVPAAPAVQNPPEVEQALALLRSRQTVRHVETTSDSRRSRSRRSSQLTGLQLAQQAQREAGDKLGNGIRPAALSRRSHKPSMPTAGQLATANANAAQAPAESALPPLTAASADPATAVQAAPAAAAAAAQAAPATVAAQATPEQQAEQPHVRRVRYTTNLPKQKRHTDKEDLIRVLNMDSPQPGIANAAGIAAYQQQAAAAQTQAQGNPAMPNSRAQAARDSAALKQMMEAREGGQAGTPVVTTGPLAPLTGA